MATAWCRNALRKQEARGGGRTLGGRSIGGFLKEAPKPPRTFLEFIFDRTNALRQSHAESLFQSQFNAARVQPPDTCMTGSTDNARGASPCRVRETPHPSAARLQPPDPLQGRVNRQHRGKPSPGACFSGSACAASGLMPGYLHGRVCKCRKRSNAGDARGEAPCMK